MNKENNTGKIKSKIDLDNGWWYCAKDIGRTLAKTKVIGLRRGIIDLILDKTFGWRDSKSKKIQERKKRKVWAYIKGKEFEEYTGAEANKVSEAISYLVNRNVIKRKLEGWKKQYSFNVNVSQWNKEVFKDKYQELLTLKGKYLISEKDSKGSNNNGFDPKHDKKVIQIDNHLDKLLTSKGKITSPIRENHFPYKGSNNRCDTIKNKADPAPKRTKRKELYIKEEEKDHISDNSLGEKEKKVVKEEGTEREELFNYWNDYNINPIPLITSYIRDIDQALKIYPIKEIQQAISNYVFILKDSDYFFDHRFTLDTFLKAKNIEKFLSLEKAKDNYLIKKVNNDVQDREEYNIPKYSERDKENKDSLNRKNYCEYYRGICLRKSDKNCEECPYYKR